MKTVRVRKWCGRWALALGALLASAGGASAQQYVFHRASDDPAAPGTQFNSWDFGQVVKRNTAVAELAVSMVNYITIGVPPDTNKVKMVFTDAANQLNFSSQINVEFSGDTVMVPIPTEPGNCDSSGFGFCGYLPATIPFSVSFRPNERGIYLDTLTFVFDYPTHQVVKLPIRGTGIGFLKLINDNNQRVDTGLYALADTRVGDSLPGSGRPISVVNTSTNQLGKIEDVVMSDVAEFHVVNPQLEIQPGQTAILSVQYSPQSLGTTTGWGKIISDDFAVDTAMMLYEGEGTLGLDYFTQDDTTDINGNPVHVVIPRLVTDTVVVGNRIDTLIYVQNKLNQNVETELMLANNHNGFKLLRRVGSTLNENDTLYFSFGNNPCRFTIDSTGKPYRGEFFRAGDTIFVGPDTIPVGFDTVLYKATGAPFCTTLVTNATIVPTTLARTLPLNDSMAVWVRFNPAHRSNPQDFADTILTIYKPFVGSDAIATGKFALSGPAVGPGFIANKDSIDFGPLTQGLVLRDSIALGNPGQLSVDVSIDTTGLDTVFTLLTETDFSYPANTVFYVYFQYAAQDNLLHLDTVHFTSNDPLLPTLDVILTGGTQASVIVAGPSSLNLGDVVVSDTLHDTVYVKNIGLTNLDVTAIATTRPVYTVTPTVFTVVPGDSQPVQVRFVPTGPVAYDDSLRISNNDPKRPILRVPISAGGSNPQYSSPGVLTFGATTLNAGSLVDSVGIRNNGTRGSMICTLSILNTGVDSSFRLAKPGDTLIFIPPGTTYQLAIRFSQSDTAVVTDSVRVVTNAPATDSAFITLSGGGFFRQLSWKSGPLSGGGTMYDYGKVSVAVAETLNSVATNLGNDTLKILSFSLASGTQGFKRISPDSAHLLQREEFDVKVSFTPPGEGLFTDTLFISTNDTAHGLASIVVPLSALAYTPGLVQLDSSLVFDTTGIGLSTVDSVGVFNPGETAVTLSTVNIVTGGRFFVAGFPSTVPPDSTRYVKVAFSPSDTLTYSDTLRVITTGPADTLKFPLSGTGAGGRYADNVDRLDFPPTNIFSTSQKSFIVTNLGNQALNIDSIYSQSGSGDFQRLSPGSVVLAPGQQSTINIGFTPSVSGAFQDTIILETSDQSAPVVRIPVSGETPDRDINLSRNRLIRSAEPELAIGAVRVAATGSRNLVIYNAGLSDLIVQTADLKFLNTPFGFVKGQWTDTLSPRGTVVTDTIRNGQGQITDIDTIRVDSMFGAIRYNPLEKSLGDTNFILIYSNDPDQDTLVVRLVASAISGQLRIVSTDSTAHFGTLKVGTRDTSGVVSLQNTFGSRVRLSQANFLTPPRPDYTVQAAIHRIGQVAPFFNFDVNNPPTIGRDSIISFRWIYHPADTGTDADIFRVIGTPDNSGDTIQIPVSGRGAAPVLVMTPTFLDYGTLKVSPPGSPKTARTITVQISNPGSDTLKIDTLRTVNAGAGHYNDTYVGTGFTLFPWRVAPGATANFPIRVVITERKVYYDTLRFINNDPLRDPFVITTRVVGTATGDVGFIDTVRISTYEQDGANIVVPVHLAFDQPIKRFSIPLTYKSSVFECVGFDFERTLLEGADGLVPEVDTIANTVAIKGNIIFGPLIEPDNFIGTVFAKLLFRAKSGPSSADSSITFDTSFIAPDIVYSFTDDSGRIILPEFVTNQLNIITGLGDDTRPLVFELEQNYPNPFNPSTTIAFSVPRAGQVSLQVFNLLGQRIRTLSESFLAPGRYEFEWNGEDESGQSVSSGIYFYHLSAAGFTETRKMVFMK